MGFFRFFKIVFLLFGFIHNFLSGQEIAHEDRESFRIHEALFEALLPLSIDEMDSTQKHLVNEAKLESFKKIAGNNDLKAALGLFGNLHCLYDHKLIQTYYNIIEKDHETAKEIDKNSVKELRKYIKKLEPKGATLPIYDVYINDRTVLFNYLIDSKVNFLRRIGFYLRLFYTDAIYGSPFGTYLSKVPYEGFKTALLIPKIPSLYTHLKYDKKKQRLKGQIDVLIIGSGVSASVAAHEFQKRGLKVLVLEKGPMVIPGAINTKDNYRFLESNGLRIVEKGNVALMNAQVVGGGSTINIDMSFDPNLPYVRHRFDNWHREGIIPNNFWTHDEIFNAYSWVKSIFHPRVIDLEEINQNNKNLKVGAENLGIPTRLYELNAFKKEDSPHEVTTKKSSFEYLLLPSMKDEQNPLTVLANCGVKKVIKNHHSAVGVICHYKTSDTGVGLVDDLYGLKIPENTDVEIYADHIVLAAGNLGTSEILLRSHIKNPNIGRGFVIHPLIPIKGKFDFEVNAHEGTPSTILIDDFMPTNEFPNRPGFLIEAASGQPSLGAILDPGAPSQVLNTMKELKNSGGMGLILIDSPNPNNRIELDHEGKLKVYYELLKEDKLRMIEGLKIAIRIMFAAGAKEVSFSTFESIMFPDDLLKASPITPDLDLDELFKGFDFTPNRTLLLAAHMMGGNKMGQDPNTSVVNSNYEVHGIGNLYVIDASIYPTSVGANPMQTIYTTAKIFSDRFLNRFGIK